MIFRWTLISFLRAVPFWRTDARLGSLHIREATLSQLFCQRPSKGLGLETRSFLSEGYEVGTDKAGGHNEVLFLSSTSRLALKSRS